MAQGFGGHRGGILSLLALHEKHPEAVEYELLSLGIRWRDIPSEQANWRDAWVAIKCRPNGGALHRALDPEGANWSVTDFILARLTHSLEQHATDFRQAHGDKRAKPPKRIRVPGMGKGPNHIQTRSMTLAELDKRLGRTST